MPERFLFTDERLGDALWAAVAALPRGSAVVLRDYTRADRAALAMRLRRLTRRHGLLLLVAGDARLARRVGADGVHRPAHGLKGRPFGVRTAAAHGRRELVAARRFKAALAFLSPVFATASHPGAPALGRVRFGLAARGARVRVAALGGMKSWRFRTMAGVGAVAWGAIDGLRPRGPATRR